VLRGDGVAYTARSVCLRSPPAARRSYGFTAACSLLPPEPGSPAPGTVVAPTGGG
jgi:hypothetical protein